MSPQLQRLPDWRARLFAEVERIARLPLRPGLHDCALFAAGCVQAQTGVDLARGWRGYRSLAAGRRALAQQGYGSEIELAAARLPEVPVAMARLGDVAVLEGDDGLALGVVQGAFLWVVGVDRLGLVERERAIRCLRV